MLLKTVRFWVVLTVLGLFLGCGQEKKGNIRIATAANMQFVMRELVKQFTSETGIGCDVVVSSSGKLTNQIKAGAPYDIFVSADMTYPEELYKKGLVHELPKVYAYGKLVLWSLYTMQTPSLKLLQESQIKHIAVTNPKTAPYGVAAMQVLDYYDLKKTLTNKLVFGESISQTNQFIISKAAEIGFTAKSVVLSPLMRDKGKYIEIDEKAYDKIQQGIVRIKRGDSENKSAKAFYDFVLSTEAQEILETFGYAAP
jgi:molybdate transport system substrate-binding protein